MIFPGKRKLLAVGVVLWQPTFTPVLSAERSSARGGAVTPLRSTPTGSVTFGGNQVTFGGESVTW